MPTPPIANVSDVYFAYTAPSLRMYWRGTGDSFEVRYRTAQTNWSDPLVTTDLNGITMLGIAIGIHYDFEVVTIVDAGSALGRALATPTGGRSVPDYYGYVIPQGITAPTDCALVSETATQAVISWTGEQALDHVITVKDEFDNVVDEIPVPAIAPSTQKPIPPATTTTYTVTIQELNPDISYQFYIGAVLNDETLFGACYIDKEKQCC